HREHGKGPAGPRRSGARSRENKPSACAKRQFASSVRIEVCACHAINSLGAPLFLSAATKHNAKHNCDFHALFAEDDGVSSGPLVGIFFIETKSSAKSRATPRRSDHQKQPSPLGVRSRIPSG